MPYTMRRTSVLSSPQSCTHPTCLRLDVVRALRHPAPQSMNGDNMNSHPPIAVSIFCTPTYDIRHTPPRNVAVREPGRVTGAHHCCAEVERIVEVYLPQNMNGKNIYSHPAQRSPRRTSPYAVRHTPPRNVRRAYRAGGHINRLLCGGGKDGLDIPNAHLPD
jgi:hypothetical protein